MRATFLLFLVGATVALGGAVPPPKGGVAPPVGPPPGLESFVPSLAKSFIPSSGDIQALAALRTTSATSKPGIASVKPGPVL